MNNIKLASLEDEARIANILMTMIGDDNPQEVSLEIVKALLSCNDYLTLIVKSKEIKGFVSLKLKNFEGANDVSEIVWLGVQSQDRRKGVGSELLINIENQAKEIGIRKIYVKVNATNWSGVCFWIMKKYMFEARLLSFGSTGIDYYLMSKNIIY